ncbi:arginase family protein [Thaumasiovibrio subtropicus]|uniref:arginase family protein n=1 Tax=Thaumasiovibrio subtropicus TaxID=1891207 RepID=UPI000B34ED56|nr:arginase family protein [Thaumasiovibrio subtropicus]
MTRKYRILGAPFNRTSHRPTANNTVEPLRRCDGDDWYCLEEWIAVRTRNWQSDIEDIGDLHIDDNVASLLVAGEVDKGANHYMQQLRDAAYQCYANGQFPIIIGGDHSIALGSVQAALDYYQSDNNERVAVIWFDAHGDLNRQARGNLHGKPLAIMTNLNEKSSDWLPSSRAILKMEDLFHIGLRDLMLSEREVVERYETNFYDMETLDARGINAVIDELLLKLQEYDRFYISFDYDVLDGIEHRACATPNVGGMTLREALTAVHRLASDEKCVGFDIVEYLPELDDNGVGKHSVIKLIDAVWGFRR